MQKSRSEAQRGEAVACVQSLMMELTKLIYKRRYIDLFPGNMGMALELMQVSFLVTVATVSGLPLNTMQISERLHIPRSNVRRHLKKLVQVGRVRRDGIFLRATRDEINRHFKDADEAATMIAAAANKLKRLRRAREIQP